MFSSRYATRVGVRALVVLALVSLSGGVGLGAPDDTVSNVILAVTARSNANVSLAASGSFVAAAWSASTPEGLTDIYAAVSRDGGATFPGTPVRVNSTPGQANVNGEQPPRVALVATTQTSAPEIAVVWTAKGDKGTRLLTAKSIDGGKTFSRAAVVPGGEDAGNRGWEGVTSDGAGRVMVTWLDHRAMSDQGEAMAKMHHDTQSAKPDGVAMAQRSHLYFSVVGDPSSVRGLTGGVCYCCKTAIAATAPNTIALAWRHVYPGNLRDIAFSISRDNGNTFASPVRVSEDKWQLEGCPDDGPTMAIDGQGVVHVVWPTLVNDAGGSASIGLFYAFSRDGKAFSNRVRVSTLGVPHHPQMTIANGKPWIVWDEASNGPRRVVAGSPAMGSDSALRFDRRVLSANGEPSSYPVVVTTPGGVTVSWTSGQSDASFVRVVRIGNQ